MFSTIFVYFTFIWFFLSETSSKCPLSSSIQTFSDSHLNSDCICKDVDVDTLPPE